MGLNVVQGAVLAGAETIVAVDPRGSRLEFAKRFGAMHVIDAAAGDPVAQVRALTDGRGVDCAFEVVGLATTIRQAYDCLAERGTAVVVGISRRNAEVYPLEQINAACAALERGETARSVVTF